MDMTDIRPELHVAQQSRRDKLRVQQVNGSSSTWDNSFISQHYNHHYHQNQSGITPDLIHVRNTRNGGSHDQASPSGLIGFSQSQIAMPFQTDVILAYQDCAAMFMNMPQAIPSSAAIAAIKDGSDPQGCSNWKPVDSSQLSCDNWPVMNYGSDQAGRAYNNVGEVLSNNFNDIRNDILDRSLHCLKPNYDVGQDIARSSMTSSEISSQDDSQRCHMNPPYQNSLQNLVTVACSGTQDNVRETTCDRGSWSGNSRGELVFLPSYGNQQPDSWLSRPVGNTVNQWTREPGCNFTRKCNEEPRNFPASSARQGLSLSLSPEIPKPSIISKPSGKLLHDVVGGGAAAPASAAGASVNFQRQVGPLGPFTGYATILKNSRFLKPAQELLDDFCNMCVSRIAGRSEASMELSNAATEEEGDGYGNTDPGIFSSTLQSCNEIGSCSTYVTFKPEAREKKAKLLFLLEEVCRRYKVYNQQMQMVMSSFESVPGLNTATPCISLALKRISRSFRSLRTTISAQLKYMAKSVGDDYVGNSISNTRLNNNNNNSSNNNNNSLQKARSLMGNSITFLEPQQQHVWRPQRGLPERAVAVLRAWLFDHFLHPYPTDTDKQMLATQTGLSRNQVSNWFINARVRVWKPMVEEIHILETRAMASSGAKQLNTTNFTDDVEPLDGRCNNLGQQQELKKQMMVEFTGTNSTNDNRGAILDQERSRVEFTRSNNMDVSGLMGLMPYNQRSSGFERGGIGSVSLTLGLRHGVDNLQTQTQTQSQGNQFGGGGRVVHDLVG